MNDDSSERLEAQLARLKPARPPAEFMARLAEARPVAAPHESRDRDAAPLTSSPVSWWRRWLIPTAAATVLAVFLVSQWPGRARAPGNRRPSASRLATLTPDSVEINRRLVAAYDAIARLPDGEPVRFRCREWSDELVLQDKVRGVRIERLSPRLEVVPVSLEVY